MRVAIFYPWNTLGGWGACGGYVETLRRMGHDVVDARLPATYPNPKDVERLIKTAPTLETLNSCDAILSLHHEYNVAWFEAVYDYDTVWSRIKTLIVGRLEESMDRFDLAMVRRLPDFKKWCSVLCYAAAQDAEKYDGPWIPHHVDTQMFKKLADGVEIGAYGEVEKKYDLAFIGSMYDERKVYLHMLSQALESKNVDFKFLIGNVTVSDLSGYRERLMMELLAENYRQVKVFFCLPPKSRLTVTKVLEAAACGTFVLAPRMAGDFRRNELMLADGKEVVYYEHGQFIDNAKQIVEYVHDDEKRERIAAAGMRRVREYYSYENYFNALIGIAKPRAVTA